jgi:predicted nucleic acid-binding protein
MLESGYSARNFQDHQDAMQKLFGPFDKLAPVPELLEIAVDLQGRLFKAGIGRSVGVADLIVAAHALHYRGEGAAVTIVHYDADYDRLARVGSSPGGASRLPPRPGCEMWDRQTEG